MDKRLKIELTLAVVLTIFGILLLIAAFCVPPVGVIDASVLIAFGEVSTFIGALLGIDYHKLKVINNIKDNIKGDL